MKKILMFLFAAFLMIGLAACNGERTYKADGEYTAFEIGTHSNGTPMITSVTVTVKNDKITKFDIDAIQSNSEFKWNEKAKKALGYDYGMHKFTYIATLGDDETFSIEGYKAWMKTNNKLEWFEQANLIEAYWLKNGFDSVTVNKEKVIDNVASVTIKDGGYIQLAKDAVQQAKDGVLKSYVLSATNADVIWAELTVNDKGEAKALVLNTLQSKVVEGTFNWNAKNKQELGYEYKMHYRTYTGTLTDPATASIDGYKTWMTANSKLEWFEQAKVLTDYVLANGISDSFKVDGNADLASVTITTNDYVTVLKAVYNKLK